MSQEEYEAQKSRRFAILALDEAAELGSSEYSAKDDFGYCVCEMRDGRVVRVLGDDRCEPEDKTLVRDLAWVADELNSLAASQPRQGDDDEREVVKVIEAQYGPSPDGPWLETSHACAHKASEFSDWSQPQVAITGPSGPTEWRRQRVVPYVPAESRQADARALWAVRMLDEWAESRAAWYTVTPDYMGEWRCTTYPDGEVPGAKHYFGQTPDAARIAAAEALVVAHPELDPDAPRAAPPDDHTEGICPNCGYAPVIAVPAPAESHQQQASGWVPVAERLPEIGQGVVLLGMYADGETRFYHPCTFADAVRRQFGDAWDDITHWMPLPPPPSEESKP